jgi:phage terminase large subunit GpA-like protein
MRSAATTYPSPDEVLTEYVLSQLAVEDFPSLSQWADEYSYISQETNPREYGKWFTDRAEYLRGIMDAYTDPRYRKIIVMKASRTGVTRGLAVNAIGYHIHLDPCAIAYTSPAKEKASKFSKIDFMTTVRDTPVLRDVVDLSRSKKGTNTIFLKVFRHGMLQFIYSTSALSFRGDTHRVVIGDDVDGFPVSVGTEGDPFSLLEKRVETVRGGKIVGISSPTVAGISRIALAYATTNQGHYYVPCPICNQKQVLVFGKNSMWAKPTQYGIIGELVKGFIDPESGETKMGLIFDRDNCSWVYYLCEHCGAQIDEKYKTWMVARGQWKFANPTVPDIFGAHISQFYSNFNTTWLKACRDFLDALKSAEMIRTWVNTTAGETYEEGEFTVAEHVLQERIEDYGSVLPKGCLVLTCGVDVQSDWIGASVWGWGIENERWLIDVQKFWNNPYDQLVWQQLDDFLHATYAHVLGPRLPIDCTFVDSGFDTTMAYNFTVPREKRRIYSIKGYDGTRDLITKKVIGKASKATIKYRGRGSLIILGVDEAKNKLYDALSKMQEGPGYVHLNDKATLEYIRGLVSEKRIRKVDKRGRLRIHWVHPVGAAENHPLDQTVYAYCAKEFLNPNFTRLAERLERFAEQEKKKENQQTAEAPQARKQQIPSRPRRVTGGRRGGWMKW